MYTCVMYTNHVLRLFLNLLVPNRASGAGEVEELHGRKLVSIRHLLYIDSFI